MTTHDAQSGTNEQQLWEAVDSLWMELDVETYKRLEAEQPELYALCQEAHHRVWHATTHEERMMQRG